MTQLQEIYLIIGMIVTWGVSIVAIAIFAWYIFVSVFNWMGNKFKTMWILVEFAIHRNEFKKWLKNKNKLHE